MSDPKRRLPPIGHAERSRVNATSKFRVGSMPARRPSGVRQWGGRTSPPPFVAIDFETADSLRDSACAVGLVRVEEGRIVERRSALIRPPRRRFLFTNIHGIGWRHVATSPTFGEIWPELAPILEGVQFLVAHNAGFDRSVLGACCQAAGFRMPGLEFQCTLQLARRTWALPSYGLAAVCDHLGIELDHHNAASDATACAHIYLSAHANAGEAVPRQPRGRTR